MQGEEGVVVLPAKLGERASTGYCRFTVTDGGASASAGCPGVWPFNVRHLGVLESNSRSTAQ
jgi:hypothetical protein